MLEPELVKDCLGNMKNSVHIPISIKCRLGVDNNESYEFLHNFISIVKESGINILNILKDLNSQGKTVIMITHNQEHASMFKKVIELVDGKILNQ